MVYRSMPVVDGETIVPDWGNGVNQGVWEAYYQSGDLPWGGITKTPTYNQGTGDVDRIDELVGGKLLRRRTYTYTGDDLTSVNIRVYDDDGATVIGEVTDTLSYEANGDWIGTTRAVVV